MNAPASDALYTGTASPTGTATDAKPTASAAPPKTLDDFATEINRTYGDFIQGIRNTAHTAKALGDLLNGAKKQCKADGIKWKPWVEKHCKCSYRSVARYMSIADKWKAEWEPGLKDATVALSPDFPFTIRKIEAIGSKPKTEKQLAAEASRKAAKEAKSAAAAPDDKSAPAAAPTATNDPLEAPSICRANLIKALRNLQRNDEAKLKYEVEQLIKSLREMKLIS
jgi:hypothetical protein